MIDTANPIATPFRANGADDPKTEYRFRTGVIQAADGSEQRHPQNRYPEVAVRFSCLATDAVHAGRIDAMMPVLMTSAVAVRDFRMNALGRVSADGASVVLVNWAASWAVGVRLVIEDRNGVFEHTATVSSADPASRTLGLDVPAPADMRGGLFSVGSAISASLDADLNSDRWHAGAEQWSVVAKGFRGVDRIGGAPLAAFPFRHGSRDAVRITHARHMVGLDHGVGRRAEFMGYASGMSGFRTYQVEAVQMSQQDKEVLVSFFCGCRGRWRSFTAPSLEPTAKFRFASDILAITHLTGEVSTATMNLARVRQ